MNIEIPQKDLSTFQALLSLSKEQFGELLDCIKRMPPQLSNEPLANLLTKTSLKSQSTEFSEIIVKFMYSYVRAIGNNMDTEDFISDFYNSFAYNNNDEAGIGRLRVLTSLVTPIETAYKIILAKRGTGKYITKQNLSVEVKPIFSDGMGVEDASLVMSYTLKFEYGDSNEDDESQTISLSFDKDDIEHLSNLIFSVQDQADALRQEFSKTSLKIID
ncbi:MAG: hypothetical protein EAZ95_02500 [Bacteroidetes bacterium]|nr:MAG: hypothetical protein EAZ95_02500 [Bacteroidota bacterium]